MTRILVTGHKGFIGSYVFDYLRHEMNYGYLVDGLDVNCSDDELTKFCEQSRLPDKVCNMCTSKPLHFSAAIQERGKRNVIISK